MTLKAFKSAIQVGMQISTSDHWVEGIRNTLRTVTKVQGNGIFFSQEGSPGRFWMEYPKAAELQFDGECARIRIGEKHWTMHLKPNGIVDHHRWERTRGNENECDAEKRMSKDAEARGAKMTDWWDQWLTRSDAWRNEIDHEREAALDEEASPSP